MAVGKIRVIYYMSNIRQALMQPYSLLGPRGRGEHLLPNREKWVQIITIVEKERCKLLAENRGGRMVYGIILKVCFPKKLDFHVFQQTFIEHLLLGTRYCSRCWQYSSEWNKNHVLWHLLSSEGKLSHKQIHFLKNR